MYSTNLGILIKHLQALVYVNNNINVQVNLVIAHVQMHRSSPQ